MKRILLLFFWLLLPIFCSAEALQITAFDAVLSDSSPGSDFTSINVTVKNIGSAPVSAVVELEVLDPLTGQPLNPQLPAVSASCNSISVGGECTLSRTPSQDDFTGFSVSSLGPGTYKLVAKAYDDDGDLHDTADFYFSIVRPIPTPELSEFLLPLVACIVIAVVLFAGRKN